MNPNALWQLASKERVNQRPDLHGLAFLPVPRPAYTGTVTSIDIRYRATRVLWKYNAKAGVYWRWADGEVHFDENTDRQISADNVVVIYADHEDDKDIIESQYEGSTSYSTQITLHGS